MSYAFAETVSAPGSPLFFTFHGTGGNERQFHDLATALLPGSHVISPRGDVSEHGALRYFRRTGEGVYDMPDLERRVVSMAAFIAGHTSRLAPQRVVGLGYSNGANILAATAMKHPGMFNDIVLLHPLIPWTPAPLPALSHLKVLVTAGRTDPICPAPLTQSLIDYFKAQGASVTANWHEGGHELRQTEIAAAQAFLA